MISFLVGFGLGLAAYHFYPTLFALLKEKFGA